MAAAASARSTKATKPHSRWRWCSSSVRGHMIFTDWIGPCAEKRLKSDSSDTDGGKLPTYRLVVSGSAAAAAMADSPRCASRSRRASNESRSPRLSRSSCSRRSSCMNEAI